jgi:hypothetical protein
MNLIVLHGQEVPSNVPNEQPGHNAPGFYFVKGECEDQGMTPERPPEAPLKRASDDDPVGEGGYDTVQSERPRGEC